MLRISLLVTFLSLFSSILDSFWDSSAGFAPSSYGMKDYLSVICCWFTFDAGNIFNLASFIYCLYVMHLLENSMQKRSFFALLAQSFVAVIGIRIIMGLLFFWSVGWNLPILFFHDSWYEGNHGLLPIILCLFLMTGKQVNLRPTHVAALGLCLLKKDCFWWNISGFLAAFAVKLIGILPKLQSISWSNCEPKSGLKAQLSRILDSCSIWYSLYIICTIFLVKLYDQTSFGIENIEMPHSSINTKSLVNFIVTTTPRPNPPPKFLLETLNSYLKGLSSNAKAHLKGRFDFTVFTHFSHHPYFEEAKNALIEQPNFSWIQEPGNSYAHHKHLIKAIEKVSLTSDTRYIGIIEDDFPLCEGKWNEIAEAVAEETDDSVCGFFFGTGGSGLVFRKELSPILINLLVQLN